LLTVGEVRADQLVVGFEMMAIMPVERGSRIRERGLLHRGVARREEDERAFFLQIARLDHGGEVLVL